ncbi:MAG: hypothetical protein J6Z25_02155 [Opitutales bacterium]|nr:hypothetical protein [Opitutales bacterium]
MEDSLFSMEAEASPSVRIKFLALGSSACRALNAFVSDQKMAWEDSLAVDTDRSALDGLQKELPKYLFGESLFRGFGAGGDTEWVQKHFSVQDETVQLFCRRAHVIFLLVGLSGGTGSGMLEIVLQIARQAGAFVVVIPLMPFSFEGKHKSVRAQTQLSYLQTIADLILPFYNDLLFQSLPETATAQEAFAYGNHLLSQLLRALYANLSTDNHHTCACHLNDFVRHFAHKPESLIWSVGSGRGEEAIMQAFQEALSSPLLQMKQDRFVPQRASIWVQAPAEIPLSTWKALNKKLQESFGGSEVSFLNSGVTRSDGVDEANVLLILIAATKNLKTERFRRKKSKKAAEGREVLPMQLDFEMENAESYWDTPTYLRLGLKLDP